MASGAAGPTGRQILRATLFGLASLGMYLCLFVFAAEILDLCSRGGWHFLIPVTIAFAFSYVHGAFTGYFWDALGVQAKR